MTIGKTENQQDVREALKLACMRAGGQKTWAIANDISETVLSDMIRGKRDVSARIAGMVGFERVTMFRPSAAAWADRPACRCETEAHRRLCLDKGRCRPMAVAFSTARRPEDDEGFECMDQDDPPPTVHLYPE